MRAWRAQNPERSAEAARRGVEVHRKERAANPERFKAYEAARYAANREQQKARVRAYRSDPVVAARIRAYSVAQRKANPEASRAAVRRWASKHPELVAHYQSLWRARKRGNGGSHTLSEWKSKCAEYDHRCAYCREPLKLTKDHALPLSRGGTDDIGNIVPACRLCNSRKRTRTPEEFAVAVGA